MDILNKLQMATIQAQRDDDLPDPLAARIFAVIDHLQKGQTLHAEIEELIEQVSLYDTYGQTGYMGMGVNYSVLEGTLARIESLLRHSDPHFSQKD